MASFPSSPMPILLSSVSITCSLPQTWVSHSSLLLPYSLVSQSSALRMYLILSPLPEFSESSVLQVTVSSFFFLIISVWFIFQQDLLSCLSSPSDTHFSLSISASVSLSDCISHRGTTSELMTQSSSSSLSTSPETAASPHIFQVALTALLVPLVISDSLSFCHPHSKKKLLVDGNTSLPRIIKLLSLLSTLSGYAYSHVSLFVGGTVWSLLDRFPFFAMPSTFSIIWRISFLSHQF